MGAGDLGHVDAHPAAGHEVVAQEDEEGLARRFAGGAQDRMAQALGIVLVGEGHGQGAGCVHGIGLGILAVVAQVGLKVGVRREIMLDLGFLTGVDDHGPVDAGGLEGLLHDILDDRLVENGQELLGHGLGGRQKAGTEARSGDDGFHYVFLSSGVSHHALAYPTGRELFHPRATNGHLGRQSA